MRKPHRARRRASLRPAFFSLLLLAAAVAAVRILSPAVPGGGQGRLSPTSSTPPPAGPSGSQAVTATGIPCTRTELGDAAIHTGDLVLVNNWTLYRFPEEQPLQCIYEGKTSSYYVRDKEVYLAPHALEALNDLMDAFQAQGGSKTVNVVAGYRTKDFQQHLFDQSAERNGQAHAEKFVAQPGGSEHHTGLVVDFSILHGDGTSEEYRGQGEYAWINQNCHRYGWIVRYAAEKEPLTGIADEPWHFRYAGVPHAIAMAAEGLCLEEYTDYLKNFPFDGPHLLVECAGGRYEIWYCAGTEAYLPDEGEYTVSGNNVDGLIVTCRTEQNTGS